MLLKAFYNDQSAIQFYMPLYTGFIVDFEKHLNQLNLVQILSKTAKHLSTPKESISFLGKHLERLSKDKQNVSAYCLLATESAEYKLLSGDTASCLETIRECEILIEKMNADPCINASFYSLSADYFKSKAAYPEYYHHALLFLSTVTLEELTQNEKVDRAYDLGIAAMLGDGLYNFGELVCVVQSKYLHPSCYIRFWIL